MQHYLEAHPGAHVGIMWHEGHFPNRLPQYHLSSEASDAAPRLIAALRELDAAAPEVILAQGYNDTGLGAAIMNRLKKAASEIIEC